MKLKLILTFCLALCLGSCDLDDVTCPLGQVNPDNACEICLTNPFGGTSYLSRNGCCIEGQFYPKGTINPDNECEYCRWREKAWTPRAPGTPCLVGSCDSLGNCN